MNESEIRRILEHSPLEPHVGEIMKLGRPAVGMRSHISEAGDIALGRPAWAVRRTCCPA